MPDMARLIAALARPAGASSDFDLNPDMNLPGGRNLRPAGVLIAILQQDGVPQVVLTKRASHLKHHPGQIAFPGGKVEQSDTDAQAAALREAEEEIGLNPGTVSVLGLLPTHETVTGFLVSPVVASIGAGFVPRPDPSEVEEVFAVPLSHLLNPGLYSIEGRYWRGQLRRYYTVPWGPYYIWGATARILRGLAERASS
jgi:8-oxo-dGTP pyrophosphatase MutT (NUDIX family)